MRDDTDFKIEIDSILSYYDALAVQNTLFPRKKADISLDDSNLMQLLFFNKVLAYLNKVAISELVVSKSQDSVEK